MKRIIAFLLTFMMLATMALPTFADEGTTTIYLNLGDRSVGQVYCYAYEKANISNCNYVWPGVLMTSVNDNIYSIEVSPSWDAFVFHVRGTFQTDILTRPTNGANQYNYSTETWSTYESTGQSTSSVITEAGSCNIGVNGNYVADAATEDVVSVDVAWESMDFTYTKGSVGTWKPDTHSYTGASDGSWSTSKSGITVKNHSNVGIEAGFTFTAESGVTTAGTFYTKGQDDTYTAITSTDAQKISLATAVGTEVANSPAGTIYFGVSGDAITVSKKLGTITVTIAKASASQDDNTSETWTEVSTPDELNDAMRSGGSIKLMRDISNRSYINFSTSTTLDLNGKTLISNIGSDGEPTDLTFDFELKNGTFVLLDSTWFLGNRLTARVTDCTITGGDATYGTIRAQNYSTLILSGTVNLEYGIRTKDESNVICHAGTYNFDPTAYIDVSRYNVTESDGIWTVTAK